MRRSRKRDFPVSQVRRYLDPGPIVLVSFECKLVDTRLIKRYGVFAFEVVKDL